MPSLNPRTTPRHEVLAEKARRNKEAALAAFIGKTAEIDEMLVRLQALSNEHFNAHPEEINWGHVLGRRYFIGSGHGYARDRSFNWSAPRGKKRTTQSSMDIMHSETRHLMFVGRLPASTIVAEW